MGGRREREREREGLAHARDGAGMLERIKAARIGLTCPRRTGLTSPSQCPAKPAAVTAAPTMPRAARNQQTRTSLSLIGPSHLDRPRLAGEASRRAPGRKQPGGATKPAEPHRTGPPIEAGLRFSGISAKSLAFTNKSASGRSAISL